jgi:predicted nuclease of restriction endonuclease-like (RecB) superfamily
MNFDTLVSEIQHATDHFRQNAIKAVNINLTLRNWIVGFYIVEFEQKGEDRAIYGSHLLQKLAVTIDVKGLTAPELSRCRQFYSSYPQILGTVTQEFKSIVSSSILGMLSQKLQLNQNDENEVITLSKKLTGELEIKENDAYLETLLITTSYSHFVELIKIDDLTKRKFYELLILKTTPSVKELQRQINTLTFERLGLTKDKTIGFNELQRKIIPQKNEDIVKSYYFFEFLNLKNPHLVQENDLEEALITHLQQFMIELGNGFCFEARQKRILIGDEYYFIDLVFYHRILKCHILVELKTEKANHEHIGQLKTYINYYKKEISLASDNPPIGILLVTDHNKALVEYAVADSDKDLFVSQYELQLPDKEKLILFIENELKNL